MGTSHFHEISTLIAGARATVTHIEDRHRRPAQPRGRGASPPTSRPVPAEELLRASELVTRQLRRALDLSAVTIFLLHGRAPRGRPLAISFPILSFNEPLQGFNELLERSMPGVAASCPAASRVLVKYQYGSSAENSWLPILKRVSDAARARPLRDREELERLLCGAPALQTLERMVTRTPMLLRELRHAAIPFG